MRLIIVECIRAAATIFKHDVDIARPGDLISQCCGYLSQRLRTAFDGRVAMRVLNLVLILNSAVQLSLPVAAS